MYFYIYDTFVSDKKNESLVHRIETRVMDLGIQGRSERLTILKSLKEIVQNASSKGADTIVAVGNDETVSKIISIFPDHHITLGIIPVGPHNRIARLLGIPEGVRACDVLSARIIEKLDLGKANNAYFLSSLHVPPSPSLVFDCGPYKINPPGSDATITIHNIGTSETKKLPRPPDPKDGILEAVITPPAKKEGLFKRFQSSYQESSVFPFKKLKIKSTHDSVNTLADGQTQIPTPVSVEVAPRRLKIIVGKDRMF